HPCRPLRIAESQTHTPPWIHYAASRQTDARRRWLASLAAQAIERPAPCQHHQPPDHRPPRHVVAAGLPPHLREHLLEDVFGIARSADDAESERVQQAGVAGVYVGERIPVAAPPPPPPLPLPPPRTPVPL